LLSDSFAHAAINMKIEISNNRRKTNIDFIDF
jgi:hypothetical protein